MALREVLEQVRSDISAGHADGANEEEAKVWFVTPILEALGWRGRQRIRFEHSIGRGSLRMDYALQGPEQNIAALIEAKAPHQNLLSHVEQMLSYAFQGGVPLCVLTTGIEWWLYLPLETGTPPQRRFATLNVQTARLEDLEDSFRGHLGYEAVIAGSAGQQAKHILIDRRNNEQLRLEIPRAWQRLLDGPDKRLIEALQQEVIDSVGLTPTREQILEALRQHPGNDGARHSASTASSMRSMPSSHNSLVTNERATDGPRGVPIRVTGYRLWGEQHQVRRQWEILNGVAQALWSRHPDAFSRLTDQTVRISRGPSPRHFRSIPIASSGYFHEQRLNFAAMRKTCELLLTTFSYDPNDLEIMHD